MYRTILFVATGGMLGTVCRFLAIPAVVKIFPYSFPFGTFFVNLVGCALMGAVVGFAERSLWFHQDWRVFLTAGFCGGFTTFSAFAFENVDLLMSRNYSVFAAYSIASFALCILAAYLGLLLTRS